MPPQRLCIDGTVGLGDDQPLCMRCITCSQARRLAH